MLSIPSLKPLTAVFILCGLAIPFIFLGIGQYGVVGTDEAFYQDIALGMLASGNFLELRSGGAIYVYDTFANAPLQYWARAGVASVLGKSMLSMRILSALSALLAVLVTYRLVLYLGGRRAGLAAGIVLITSFQFLYLHSARTGELEPTVCLLLVSCALLFIRTIDDPSRHWWPHHLLLAVLFNLKAPIIVIPVAAELIAFAVIASARPRLAGWLGWGCAVLPIAVLWHGYQAFQYPDQVRSVFTAVGHQMAGDFAVGPKGGVFGRTLYYGQKLVFGGFPYVLIYPLAVIAAGRASLPSSGVDSQKRRGILVLLVYLFTIFAFYLGISKVGPWYIVHAYPFLAALVGLYLGGRQVSREQSWHQLAVWGVVLSLLFWVTPQIAGYNPFSADAYVIPMLTFWRSVPAVGPEWGVPALALVIFAGLMVWRRSAKEGLSESLALMLFVLFTGYGAIRCLAPLAYIHHLSPIAALDADLQERVAVGSPLPFPVDVPRTHPWIVNYYFNQDFKLRISPKEERAAYRKPMEYVLLGWKPGRKGQATP